MIRVRCSGNASFGLAQWCSVGSNPVERWPERNKQTEAVGRTAQPPTHRSNAGLHQARELQYQHNGGRETAWEKLGSNAQRVLRSRVGGEIIEWWASLNSDGKCHAVALGTAGLCEADPLTTRDGKRAHRIKTVPFMPDSLTSLTWRQTVDSGTPDRDSTGSQETTTPPLASYLSDEFCGFLGNLPARAQEMIQEPYTPQRDLVGGYYSQIDSDLSGTAWSFWCYLADNQILTFCSGSKVTQRAASPGRASWKMTCYRAFLS